MYGEKIVESDEKETGLKKPSAKGWFPYKCVRVSEHNQKFDDDDENAEKSDKKHD